MSDNYYAQVSLGGKLDPDLGWAKARKMLGVEQEEVEPGRNTPQHRMATRALTQAPPQKGTPPSMKSIPRCPRRTMSRTLPKPRWMRPIRICTVCGRHRGLRPLTSGHELHSAPCRGEQPIPADLASHSCRGVISIPLG